MPAPIATDLRMQLIKAVQTGESLKDAAAQFGVNSTTAYRWWNSFKTNGHVDPKYVTYETVFKQRSKVTASKRVKHALRNSLREQLVAAVQTGESVSSAAKRLSVAKTTALRWRDRFLATGEVTPRRRGGDVVSYHSESFAEAILAEYRKNPDARLIELQRSLATQGLTLSRARLHRFFKVREIWLRGLGRPSERGS